MMKIILGIICFFIIGFWCLRQNMRDYYKNKLKDINNGFKEDN